MQTISLTNQPNILYFIFKSIPFSFFIFLVLFKSQAQNQEKDQFILSSRVGLELDSVEIEYFNIFPGLDRVKSVVYRKDVSMIVGSGPYTIPPGDTLHVGFAIVGGENLQQIQDAANEAQTQWPLITGSAKPMVNKPGMISVYPNPAGSELWITGLTDNSDIRIFTMEGKSVSVVVNKLSSTEGKVEIGQLEPGVYFGKTSEGKNFRFVKN